ncbi:hypothetical protein MIMGU_mgv11b015335mg [Erythranthe guttata]|uniref:NB-ARC domain-containing protein n=1 Tax=Erythranthe guttata TaxID=4155 RepID=A0A022PTC1_ERYGU|nr:hypothetical protein MIMGU_mgv11b015335mg [Erythranthe guttata]
MDLEGRVSTRGTIGFHARIPERDDFRKKVILVLDNVWEVNLSQWDTLKNILRFGCHGSKVLLTTRK